MGETLVNSLFKAKPVQDVKRCVLPQVSPPWKAHLWREGLCGKVAYNFLDLAGQRGVAC